MTKIDDVDIWYLAGPMSNIPKFNVPAFLEGREDLEGRGLKVQLPADLDDPEIVAMLLESRDGTHMSVPGAPSWAECLAEDVKLIGNVVGGIILLPGWERSRGARLETFVAVQMFGKPVVHFATLAPATYRELAAAWLGDDLWSEVTALEEAVVSTVTRKSVERGLASRGVAVALVH